MSNDGIFDQVDYFVTSFTQWRVHNRIPAYWRLTSSLQSASASVGGIRDLGNGIPKFMLQDGSLFFL